MTIRMRFLIIAAFILALVNTTLFVSLLVIAFAIYEEQFVSESGHEYDDPFDERDYDDQL